MSVTYDWKQRHREIGTVLREIEHQKKRFEDAREDVTIKHKGKFVGFSGDSIFVGMSLADVKVQIGSLVSYIVQI